MTKTVKKFCLSVYPTGFEIPTIQVKSSHDLFQVMQKVHLYEGNEIQEFFYVFFMNQANRVTGYYLASMGGVTGTVADPRLIIKAAALADCTAIALCHNHPSGNLKPSRQDEQITSTIKEAAKFFSINVCDHLIISEEGYFSFADGGII